MQHFIGIDGGGTKTAYIIANEKNEILFSFQEEGLSYKEKGIDVVVNQLKNGIQRCLQETSLSDAMCKGIVVGLPCFGESQQEDLEIEQKIKKEINIPVYLVNDVEVGWAGSLNLTDGINLVAGTGSIAFGRNSKNEIARSGGWSTFFSDEGSCYWLGRRTLELFCKEADYRLERNALYTIMKDHYKISNDVQLVEKLEKEIIPYRDKVAQLQQLLFEAAKKCDPYAKRLYQEAAEELFLIIKGVAIQLDMVGKEFYWSYSGGLFHAKEFVLPQLIKKVETLGGKVVSPRKSPVEGAVMLAMEKFNVED